MINLNTKNVEDLIFYDSKIHNILEEDFSQIFAKWKLSKSSSALRSIGQKAILDFLNTIDGKNLIALEKYFGTAITVDRLNYNIVENKEFNIDNLEENINKLNIFSNFTMFRDNNKILISFWR